MKISSKPTVVEVFAGAGLFSHAFRKEGFNIVRAVEIDSLAAETYARNLGDHIETGDVLKLEPKGGCDVILAGSPCQGYSTLGKRDPNDPRNFLSLDIVRWARIMRPQIIIIENVKSFLESFIWSRLKDELCGLGYAVDSVVLNAYDFGVPQLRSRSFTFAVRHNFPIIKKLNLPGYSTVKESWADLPKKPNGRNYHYAPSPSQLALGRMKVIPTGGDKRDVMRNAPNLTPPSWWKLYGEATDVWGRLEWGKPSNTLRTCLQNPSKGRYIHPEQHRVISLREACRLHTIPDEWVFAGFPIHIAKQIGNSVPPNMGRTVARAVYESLV